MLDLSAADQRLLAEERSDPRTVMLRCSKHNYYGPSKVRDTRPTEGCSQCWMVYYIHDICSVPPSEREGRIAEITEIVAHLNEAKEKGKFDYTPGKLDFTYDHRD